MSRIKNVCCLVLALCMIGGITGCKAKNKTRTTTGPSKVQTASVEPEENPTASEPDTAKEPVFLEEPPAEVPEEPPGLYSSAEFLLKNGSTPIQKNFLGFNGIYHAYTFCEDSYGRVHTERSARAELDAVKNSGISIARTYYDHTWAWDAHSQKWDFDGAKMQSLYRWCLELKNRGIQVHLNYWYAYRDLFDQYRTADHANKKEGFVWAEGKKVKPFYVAGDREKTMENFADFIQESLAQLRAKGCTNVTYLSLATEPGFTYYETEKISAEEVAKLYAKDFLSYSNAVHRKLESSGLRKSLTIVGPNEGAMTTPNGYLSKAVSELDTEGAIDLYSSHSYYKTTAVTNDSYYYWNQDIQLKLSGLKGGKDRFIFDEYGVLDDAYTTADDWRREKGAYGTQIALQQIASLNNGIKGSYIWTLMDQQWPDSITTNNDFFADGVHQWGLLPNYQVNNIPYPGFYAFQLMANYVGVSGAEVYACDYTNAEDSGLYAAMVKLPNGEVSIAVVNANFTEAAVKFSFEKAIGKTLYRRQFNPEKVYRTASAACIPPSAKISNCATNFVDVVPALGVTVYTSVK